MTRKKRLPFEERGFFNLFGGVWKIKLFVKFFDSTLTFFSEYTKQFICEKGKDHKLFNNNNNNNKNEVEECYE
jgi:hypothetical protein